jgi:CRISPR-associated protein Cas1
MIKRTLYFGNPAYLKTIHDQMIIERPEEEPISVPIEDIGIVILDHKQITITQALISKLLEHQTALITCDHTHHPTGLLLTLDGHTLQSKLFKAQIEATIPLKKQMWQQTICSKIYNQAILLAKQGEENNILLQFSKDVKSGDSENLEGQAAVYYWKYLFPPFLEFSRDRYGNPPNNLLNYGYAILRACMARSIVASGLLPTLGIFHRNQYNAYCLADDLMEPYRPYVDQVVCKIVNDNGTFLELGPKFKKELLSIPALDVVIDGKKSPMINAIQRTTTSVARCFENKNRKILYPIME